MADARVKHVMASLVDTYSRRNYIFRNVLSLSSDVGYGDVIELPYDSAPATVAGGTRAAPTAGTPSIASLTVDQFPSKRRLHPLIDEIQLLGPGNIVSQRAQLFTSALMADADSYLLGLVNTAAGTEVNTTGTVALSDFHEAEAAILDQEGIYFENLLYAYHPLAIPQIKAFFDPPRGQDMPGMVGIPGIQSINGIPAVMTRSVPLLNTTEPGALLMDRSKVYWAEQAMPAVKFVDDPESMSTILQVGMIYGGAVFPNAAQAVSCRA